MEWKDGKRRCCWANSKNELYVRYHDQEWGVPAFDDQRLFEMLVLECFQAGLSWECVLNKREAFRSAFDGFDLDKVCSYDEEKLESLHRDQGIIRNKLKIEASVNNAKVFRSIQKDFGSFSSYLWGVERGQGSPRKRAHELSFIRCDIQGLENARHEIRGNGHRLRLSPSNRGHQLPRRWMLLGGFLSRPIPTIRT